MISAGFIGGGATLNPPPYANFEGKAENIPAGNITWEQIHNDNKSMWGWSTGLDMANQGIQSLFGIWAQSIYFGAMEDINNRRMEAMENISDDRREVELKWLETMEKADKRMNERGGLRERLAEIESHRDERMYDRRMERDERIAAMRGLDSAFSVRSEYSYGNPYAYA